MKKYLLNVFEDFKCIAGSCKHSCCEKWIINIDKKSLKKYKRVKGNLKKIIDDGVDYKTATFKMNNDRCYFLNKDNLCDIIINLGEKSLCQVCRDHPRFRNYFKNRVEEGVGLSCEVIARKIFSFNDRIEIVKNNGFSLLRLSKFEREKLEYRDKIFDILLKSDLLFNEKIDLILNNIITDKHKLFNNSWKRIFCSLEILDNAWQKKLELLDDKLSIISNNENYLTNLLCYFIYRHVSNAFDKVDLYSNTVFSILSVIIIENMAQKINKDEKYLENIIEIAREYSSEIEYSENNLSVLLNECDSLIKII